MLFDVQCPKGQKLRFVYPGNGELPIIIGIWSLGLLPTYDPVIFRNEIKCLLSKMFMISPIYLSLNYLNKVLYFNKFIERIWWFSCWNNNISLISFFTLRMTTSHVHLENSNFFLPSRRGNSFLRIDVENHSKSIIQFRFCIWLTNNRILNPNTS